MATTKPRIQVTVSCPVYETISRMAKLQGTSRSAIVSELLDTVHPPLMRTVALIEAAMEAPAQVKQGLRVTVEAIEAQLVATAGGGIAQMDWLLQGLTNGQETGGESGGERREAPVSTPVPVTRGSGQRKPLIHKESAKTVQKARKRVTHKSSKGVRNG